MHYTNQFLRACSTDWYDKTKINLQVQSECTMRKFRSIQMYMSLHGISSLAGPTLKNESGQTRIGDLCFTRREFLGVLI